MRATGYALDDNSNAGHTISVVPGSNGGGQINWGCSTHQFTDLAEIISNIEKVKDHPEAWLVLRTTHDSPRYVRVEGGRLYASQDNPRDDAESCDYEDFRAAVLAAANSDQERKGMT